MDELQQDISQRLDFQNEMDQSLFKNLILINGGAIIALLTFMGNAKPTIQADDMKWAFTLFSGALCLTLCAYIGGYFSQASYMNYATYAKRDLDHNFRQCLQTDEFKNGGDRSRLIGNATYCVAIVCVVGSLAMFITGAMASLRAITLG